MVLKQTSIVDLGEICAVFAQVDVPLSNSGLGAPAADSGLVDIKGNGSLSTNKTQTY